LKITPGALSLIKSPKACESGRFSAEYDNLEEFMLDEKNIAEVIKSSEG
jgi:hypothetical protein